MRVCADCGKAGPTWASVNHGVLLCEECCSIHRNIGRHVSWVRPLQQISPTSLLMMIETLNKAGANNIWEHTLLELPTPTLSCKPSSNDPLHSTKEEFIRKKYEELKFTLKSEQNGEELDSLGAELHASARTTDLLTSLRLLAQGADPNFYHEEKGSTPLHVAAKSGQLLQVELLVTYGADLTKKDSSGKTPEECAFVAKHIAVAERLQEMKYQVRDRLTNYLYSKKQTQLSNFDFLKNDMSAGYDLTEVNNEARLKLEMLSNSQFEKLVADIYDEVDRREAEIALLTSNNCREITPGNSAPFLPVHPELSSTRNQGRQKLACLTNKELNTLINDVLQDSKRRDTSLQSILDVYEKKKPSPSPNLYSQLLMKQLKSEISDEEPLYDSVASDEDYAYTDKVSNEGERNGNANFAEEKNVEESDLRRSLASSLATISRLQSEIRLLQDTVAGLIKENRELKDEILQVKSFARGIEASSEGEAEPVSDNRGQRVARPTSMYETREGLRYWNAKNDESRTGTQSLYQRQTYVQDQPRYEDVIRRTEQVCKRVKELWTAVVACDYRTFVPCAERIRVAVAELIAIFPQSPPDELIGELVASTTRLQMECGSLQNCSSSLVSERLQQIRNCAYDIAMATKLIIMKSEGC